MIDNDVETYEHNIRFESTGNISWVFVARIGRRFNVTTIELIVNDCSGILLRFFGGI